MTANPVEFGTTGSLAAKLHLCLATLQEWDVHPGRFREYAQVLDRASSGITLTLDTPEEKRWFFESANQAQQLIDAFPLCEAFPSVCIQKMRTVTKGLALPSERTSDGSRECLSELVVGAHLGRMGFEVEPTHNEADFRVSVGGVELVVEVKRPTSLSTVEKNIQKLRRQLRGRRTDGLRVGVLAADRVFGLSRTLGIDSPEAFDILQRSGIKALAAQMQEQRLFSAADAGGVVLSGAVYCESIARVLTFSLASYFGGPEGHKSRAKVEAIFAPRCHQVV